MPRSRTRARQRRQRLEADLREAVASARNADAKALETLPITPGGGEFWQLLRRIDRSDLCVWDIARAIHCTDDEMAMIAQAVAPHLTWKKPGSVLHGQKRAK
jgi:hypothetical protein